MHRRQRAEQLRRRGRARRPQLGRGQPRRPQRLRDLARQPARSPSSPATRKSGALRQLPAGFGCISGLPVPGLRQRPRPDRPRRGRRQPRRATTSTSAPSSATRWSAFARDPASGALTQPSGTAGCIAEAISGCAVGIGLGAVEGLAVSLRRRASTPAAPLSNAVAVLARDPATGALAQATDGSGCIVSVPLTGCTTRLRTQRRQRGRGQPRRQGRLRHLAAQQQRHLLHPRRPGRRPDPEDRHRRLPGLAARRRLLLRPGAERPRGARRLPGRGQRLRRRLRDRRDRRPRPQRSPAKSPRRPGSAGCLAPKSVPGCTPRPGAARRQLDRASAPTAAISTRPRSAATPSTSSGGTNERVGRPPGRPHPQTAARLRRRRGRGAAALPGRRGRAGAGRGERQEEGRRRDEHHPLPHRPGTGDPALPAELAAPEPAGDAAAAPARAQLRTRLHQRLHVLARALDPDERLLPRPARGQVHARGRHAGGKGYPQVEPADRTDEPRRR